MRLRADILSHSFPSTLRSSSRARQAWISCAILMHVSTAVLIPISSVMPLAPPANQLQIEYAQPAIDAHQEPATWALVLGSGVMIIAW